MDINFPLILMLLVTVTGLIWLFDSLFLKQRRLAAISNVTEGSSPSLDSESQLAVDDAKESLAKEPALVEYSKSFFPVLFIVFVLRSFLVEPFQIPSASMVPTLKIGDFILVNKFTYGIRLPVFRNKVLDINEPERGDVMVFFPPHKDIYFIKRVIGLPGDQISYQNNVLYVNGEKVPTSTIASLPPSLPKYQIVEETVYGKTFETRKETIPGILSIRGNWVVPEGKYFVMGDNRDNSSDSRDWGFVPEENIVGKAFAVWMHWESLLSLPSFSTVGSIE